MAPPRRLLLRKEPTLERATSIGITLPSFNFVEARPPRRRRDGPRATTASSDFPPLNGVELNNPVQQPAVIDLDEVLYSTVSRRAELFEDPSMTQETKMARIWQALLRHSERGRFGNPEAGSVNPICTALCLEATDKILAACGASILLRSVLVGGLANSVYTQYDPDQGFEKQQQYAELAWRQSKQLATQDEEIAKLAKLRELAEQHVFDQLSAAGVGQLLQQMDLSRRVSAVTEMLAPVLDDDLLLVLWNATATTQASANQLLRVDKSEIDVVDASPESMSWNETRKRGAALASLVLQERVRLVILVWQKLSTEEKRLAYKALDPSISTTQAVATLKSVLHALEETDNGGDGSQPTRPNRDLLHELQASPHLVACLSAMDPNVLQEVFLGNIDAWAPFFVDMVASNDTLLRQSVVQRTHHVEGGDTLLRLLIAVIDGTTAVLDLAALDRALSASDVEQAKLREACARRKEHQCIYLRGQPTVFGAIVAPQIAVVGYNPRRFLPCQTGSLATSAAGPAMVVSSIQERGNKDNKAGSDENVVEIIDQSDGTTRFVELDDVMNIFLKQWTAKTHQTEERYRQAFAANDLGGDRIGMNEFVKIVTGVSAGRISARECRLVFSDAGQEFMNIETFIRVTRAYQLRAFDTHLPEVSLDEHDLQDLRLSVGRANVVSTQREVEDLARYWRSVRSDVVHQLEAAHQKKTTKNILKKQSALIERLVASTPPLHQQLQVQQPFAKRQATSSAHTAALQEKLDRVWHEVRTCVKMLQRAKLTQHYLCGLFIRSNMLRWIRQARKRAHEEERSHSRLPAPLLQSSSGISKAGSTQSINASSDISKTGSTLSINSQAGL
ncbi:uncharacterized protein IUM83_10820 [Phytophthora cinnamomi]|uniref:uncharacterized protein n=1 Tax=Phytophthora cinnamomi TaxID=4785 RepID=UPI0035594E02|nr:hypothetical protein IUM83_10820 [Phytophthora cinnamomi]